LTTPGDRPSKAKRLRFGTDGEKIKVITLNHELDPRKTPEWLERQRERRSAEDFAREIMINWEGSIEGRVYPEVKQAEFDFFPYDPAWGLYFSWDFGLDGVGLGAWQINPLNGKLRLVDSYENNNVPIQFYFPLLGQPTDSVFQYNDKDLEAIQAFKDFKKAIHYGDPDVSKRSFSSQDMKSTRRALTDIGVYIQTRPDSNTFVVRREKTKIWLQRGIEVNNTPRNEQWLECIKNARYPQRTENSQQTSEVNLPIHDFTSHHRTSLEYLCVNLDPPKQLVEMPLTIQEKIRRNITSAYDARGDGIND
jgi:hypothetical protein